MRRDLTYSQIVDKQETIKAWLTAQFSAISAFSKITDQIGVLLNDVNVPLLCVFNDAYTFQDKECDLVFSLTIKNKGSSSSANSAMLKSVLDILEDRSLGRNCTLSSITDIQNIPDTASAASVESKSIYTRIELEVNL